MTRKEVVVTGAMIMLVTYTLGLSLVSQAFPADQTTTTLSSAGTIQIQTSAGLGVYQEDSGSVVLSSVSWGTLQPGESQNVICYIKNEGNSATIISLDTSNWSPTNAESYLNLNWDYNGYPIAPDAVIPITLTLSVDSNIEGISTFSFDITIVGVI